MQKHSSYPFIQLISPGRNVPVSICSHMGFFYGKYLWQTKHQLKQVSNRFPESIVKFKLTVQFVYLSKVCPDRGSNVTGEIKLQVHTQKDHHVKYEDPTVFLAQ